MGAKQDRRADGVHVKQGGLTVAARKNETAAPSVMQGSGVNGGLAARGSEYSKSLVDSQGFSAATMQAAHLARRARIEPALALALAPLVYGEVRQ